MAALDRTKFRKLVAGTPLLLLLALPLAAWGQYAGPAVETCRAHGERELKRTAPDVKSLVFDRDAALAIERTTRKMGSQFVSSILTGNGAIQREIGPAVELSFLCLLASDKQALFFYWMPRKGAPALAQCKRGAAPGDCLQLLLDLAERDLVEVAAFRFQDSLEADAKSGTESASNAFRNSASAWRAYRDAECARRSPAGSDEWRACMVDLTRRRYLDLQ
ncbi:MAG TPA: lysozyme inhibitor LprI family protein [Burkholderiales bacterium]